MIYNKLLFISAVLLSISVSLSIALDNVAIVVGIIGLIWFIIKGEFYIRKLDFNLFLVSLPGFISSIFSGMLIYSLKNAHYIWHFLPYFIVSRVEKKHIRVLLNIFAIFLIIASCGVFFEAFFHIRPNDVIFKHIYHLHFYHSIMFHSSGFFNNPLTTAGVMAPSALLFLSLIIFYRENVKTKILYLFAFISSFAAVLIFAERGYWLGFLFAILVLPFIYRKKVLLIITLFVIAISALVYFSIQPIQRRVNSIYYFQKDVTAMDRVVSWKTAFDVFKHESIARKLIGCGKGNVGDVTEPYLIKNINLMINDKIMRETMMSQVKHNILRAIQSEHLHILIQWGIVGLLIWLYLWFYVIKENIKFINKKTDDKFSLSLVIGLTLAFVAFLIDGFFERNVGDVEVTIFIMYLLGLNGAVKKPL